MSDEAAEALYVGVGVAATCVGVMCSLYHCCCRVWRRLKGHTPVAAAGAVIAAGALAAGQLTGVSTAGPPPSRGDQATCRAAPEAASPQDSGCGNQANPTNTSHTVIKFFYVGVIRLTLGNLYVIYSC
jgi:hypothetical protein